MSWEATCGLVPRGAQHGRGRFIRPKRASSANMMRKLRPRLAAIRRAFLTACGKLFFEVVLSLDVALGMEWTRHQLAPAMPGQEIVNGAVAGRMPYRLFIGRLEVLDVEQLGRPWQTFPAMLSLQQPSCSRAAARRSALASAS